MKNHKKILLRRNTMAVIMIKEEQPHDRKSTTYTIEEAMNITNDIFNLNKEKEYNPGAFIHGLIFALEALQQSYNIPQKQLAEIKRGCRRYFKEFSTMQEEKK
jgi:hypothetical protein